MTSRDGGDRTSRDGTGNMTSRDGGNMTSRCGSLGRSHARCAAVSDGVSEEFHPMSHRATTTAAYY